jgi:A/G-specific adenine glycosylase
MNRSFQENSGQPAVVLSATALPRFRRQLLQWYDRNSRDLPWRQTSDPYRIWISEVMLQQTQVVTVIDYYHRFLQRFPNVETLADAEIEEVLRLWSGLGYYRRARSLHSAAQAIVQLHGGKFPESLEQLRQLAGIGRYTAGAIASFAFDMRAPILEANTIRLFARVLGLSKPVASAEAQVQLWEFAEQILPSRSGARKLNQAVMELGSLVCTPAQPNCQQCPVRGYCQAHQQGRELNIPVLKSKPVALPLVHVGAIFRNRKQQVLLRQNSSSQWWSGLWDLPWIEPSSHLAVSRAKFVDPSVIQALNSEFQSQLRLDCNLHRLVDKVSHAVTRYKIQYLCLQGELIRQPVSRHTKQFKWFSLDQLPPMVARFRRLSPAAFAVA